MSLSTKCANGQMELNAKGHSSIPVHWNTVFFLCLQIYLFKLQMECWFACLVTGCIASYSSSCHQHHHHSPFLAYFTSRYSFCLLLRSQYPFCSNNDQVNITLMWFSTLIHNNNPKRHKLYIIKMSTNPITTKNFVNGYFSCKPGQLHHHKLYIAQYEFVLQTWRDMV